MPYDLNDPNLDFAGQAEILARALKQNQLLQNTQADQGIGGSGIYARSSPLSGVGAALSRGAGQYNQSQAEASQTALNQEQLKRYDELTRQMNTPGTKSVLTKSLRQGEGPLMEPNFDTTETKQPLDYSNPDDLIADNSRRMAIATQMSKLPLAQKTAQDYLSKGAAFPEAIAQLQMKQIEAGQQNASRALERERYDKEYRLTASQQREHQVSLEQSAALKAAARAAPEVSAAAANDMALQLVNGRSPREIGIPAKIAPQIQERAAEIRAERGMTPQQTATTGTDLKERDAATRYFTSGQGAARLAGFNTVAEHMDTMSKLGEALTSGDIPLINKVIQFVQKASGDPSISSFDVAKNFVAKEMGRALIQAGGGVGERQKIEDLFATASSPAQLSGAIATAKELLSGQFKTMERQYSKTGRDTSYFRDKELGPAAQKLVGHSPGATYKSYQGKRYMQKPGTNGDNQSDWMNVDG